MSNIIQYKQKQTKQNKIIFFELITVTLQKRKKSFYEDFDVFFFHMWAIVVGSLLCSERFFSWYSGFPSPQNPTFPNSNSIRNRVDEEPLCGCATSKSSSSLLLLLLLLLFFLSSSKTNTFKFQFNQESDRRRTTFWISATSKSFCIYLFTADEVHQDERLGVLLILVEQVSCRTR